MSADSDVASPSGKKKKSVHFAGSSLEPSGLEMDQGLAQRLFESGSALVFLDVPPGTEFGIDLVSWNVGQKFKGVKMIPDGVHFIYWRFVNIFCVLQVMTNDALT